MSPDQKQRWFVYHSPTPSQTTDYKEIRSAEEHTHVVFSHAANGRVWDNSEKQMVDGTLQACFDAVNDACCAFAVLVEKLVPDSADKTMSIRCIRKARMYQNEALTLQARKEGPGAGDWNERCDHEAREALREARMWANAAIACGGV